MPENDRQTEILLVDDEPVICDTLCSILKEDGYQVTTAKSGREAVFLTQNNNFDLAIIDLKLPDIDGMRVLHEVKTKSPNICAIIITAYPTTDSAIRAIQEEAYEYITKPFDISHVKLVIKRGLEEKRLELENKRLVKNLQGEKKKLETIIQIGHAMNSILNVDDLAQFIVNKIAQILRARICSLMLFDDEEETLSIKAAVGLDDLVIKTTKVKIGQSISGWVAKEGEPVLVTDIENDLKFGRTNLPNYESKSFLCIPLKAKNKVIGVINVSDKKIAEQRNIFSEGDLHFLSVICNYAAVAIENALLYGEVKNLAITDGLTALYNHRYFQTQLNAEVDRVKRYPHQLSLILLDIDSFKEFNDSYGHQLGDMVLSQIAKTVKKTIRRVDIACRYGGEELAVILPETGIKEAAIVAEKIRKAIEELRFETGKGRQKKQMTVSGGVAELKAGSSKEELVNSADQALYKAKGEGKNKICIYSQLYNGLSKSS